MRWTVDYEEDFNFVSRIFEYFSGREVEFTAEDILQAIDSGKVADNLVPPEYRNVSLVNGVEGV
jgi:spore coat polysaccharide biosynthesis protein SpsF (cytidylyltransferase family)